jgi:hypothetical protein
MSYSKFDSVKIITTKVEQTLILQYDSIVNDMKESLKTTYIEADRWNLQHSLTSDTI